MSLDSGMPTYFKVVQPPVGDGLMRAIYIDLDDYYPDGTRCSSRMIHMCTYA